jgi:hypothetical protein
MLNPSSPSDRAALATDDSARDVPEIGTRWRGTVVLKRDVFSTVERGFFMTPDGEVEAVLRRIDQVPWWSSVIARALFARERKLLRIAGDLGVAAHLHYGGRSVLVRGWIDGVALQVAKPFGEAEFFRSAKIGLCKLRRAGICHNDLSKQQNWLRGPDGRAYFTDFQLAMHFPRRGLVYRVLAYEDLRHLLKHKHRYMDGVLTPTEQRMRARKSLFTRAWMASGKRLYEAVTRGLLHYRDTEGGGPRLAYDAPRIAERLRGQPDVKDVAVVAFFDRGARNSLYAFVESAALLKEETLRAALTADGDKTVVPPEYIQVVPALPRRENGDVRTEILQLIASNQIDLIDSLVRSDEERQVVATITANRHNLRDKF